MKVLHIKGNIYTYSLFKRNETLSLKKEAKTIMDSIWLARRDNSFKKLHNGSPASGIFTKLGRNLELFIYSTIQYFHSRNNTCITNHSTTED